MLIKTRAATVFAGDCELRAFRISATCWLPVRLMVGITRPRQPILGRELAGEIEAVGAEVTKFAPGDKIFAATGLPTGSYAQYTCLPQDGPIAPLPSSMSFDEAATVPIGGLNALHFIRRAQIQTGERILMIRGVAASALLRCSMPRMTAPWSASSITRPSSIISAPSVLIR